MAKSAGRLCVIKKNGTAIAGARTTGITWNGSAIDVTDGNDSGIQAFLDGVMTGDTLEMTVEGVEDGQVLRDIAFGAASGKFFSDLTFTFPNGDVISGDFVMTTYTESGAYEDAQTFNATFVRNGSHTYTPAV